MSLFFRTGCCECGQAQSSNAEPSAAGSSSCAGGERANVEQKDGPSTIALGILSTSSFIWLPACQPHQSRSNSEVVDAYLVEAMKCPRWHIRRNALCDHMRLLLPQKTRERLEKDIQERKTSLTRRVSQYIKSLYTDDYEVDLV